jgi:hypothetical protein
MVIIVHSKRIDMKTININVSSLLKAVIVCGIALSSCQKMSKPPLGDYPQNNVVTPTTPLRFYVSFDSAAAEDKQINLRFKDSISGNPSFFPDNSISVVPGVHGTAFKGNLDNNLSYLNVNDWGKSTSFTVAFWEKKSGINNSDAEFVFSIPSTAGHWSNSNMLLIFDHKGAGSTADSSVVKLMVAENSGAVDHWFELTGSNRLAGVTDGQWHHLAFAYDEATSQMKIYKDGALYNTQSWAGHGAIKMDNSKATGFYLGGKTTDWGKAFNGSIDQFRLYNKALSATEIQNLYTSKM